MPCVVLAPPPFSHAWAPFGVVGQPPESLALGSISWTAGFIASFSDPFTVKQERKKGIQKNYNSSSTLYVYITQISFSPVPPFHWSFFLMFFILKFSHSLSLSLSLIFGIPFKASLLIRYWPGTHHVPSSRYIYKHLKKKKERINPHAQLLTNWLYSV